MAEQENTGVGDLGRAHSGPLPMIMRSEHRADIEAMLVVSKHYTAISRYIEHKYGEKCSLQILKKYRRKYLADRVAEYEKKRADIEKSTDDKDEQLRRVAELGKRLIRNAQRKRTDILEKMDENVKSAISGIRQGTAEISRIEKRGEAATKKIYALTRDLETGFEQYRQRLKESVMSPLEVYLYLKNCGLLVIENKMSLMMKMPMAMNSVMADLRVVSELNDKVRDEMISLGQHPPVKQSMVDLLGNGNVFVGNNQVGGQMNVSQGQREPEMTRAVARAALLYLGEVADQRRRELGVEVTTREEGEQEGGVKKSNEIR